MTGRSRTARTAKRVVLFGAGAPQPGRHARAGGGRSHERGATPRALVTLVAAQALLLTVAGLVIGTAASLAVTPLMASLLFGVPARDLSTLAAVAGVLLAVALAASIVPARRALRSVT